METYLKLVLNLLSARLLNLTLAASCAISISLLASGNLFAQALNTSAGQCDPQRLEQLESLFDELAADPHADPKKLTNMARITIDENNRCFDSLYKDSDSADSTHPLHIDDGGIMFDTGIQTQNLASAEFRTSGRKWGAGSPFFGGQNRQGPGIPGGTVTYSFMPSGVSNNAETGTVFPNTALAAIPSIAGCFATEVARAFAMWSAVANIQFQRVFDNGVPFNAGGASASIRIGAHNFDGRSGTLAHAFFPPPNGVSAAGDVHLDTAEFWTCNTSGIDVGIVLTHELGHAIGLNHEEGGNVAIMNPFYNPNVGTLRQDDINGAVAIYGPAAITIAPPPPPPPPPAPPTVIAPIIDLILLDDN